jgi:nucleotide-binding universal stress UspA family protein
MATKFESKLTLLHAYQLPTANYGYADSIGLLWPVDDLSRVARAELDSAVQRAKEQYPATDGVLACGEPWQEILETAKRAGADLIVMGTHGRRGLSRVFLGSVAEKVVRLAPMPVLIVSSKEEEAAKQTALASSTTKK